MKKKILIRRMLRSPQFVIGFLIVLAVVIFLCMREKHLKKLHPIVFIAASAVVGVLFQF